MGQSANTVPNHSHFENESHLLPWKGNCYHSFKYGRVSERNGQDEGELFYLLTFGEEKCCTRPRHWWLYTELRSQPCGKIIPFELCFLWHHCIMSQKYIYSDSHTLFQETEAAWVLHTLGCLGFKITRRKVKRNACLYENKYTFY